MSQSFTLPTRRGQPGLVVWLLAGLFGVLFIGTMVWAFLPEATGPLGRFWAFIVEGQRAMTDAMKTAVRRIQGESPVQAAAVLSLVAFIYGVLHAAGPGHGKFVISSYALATEKTVQRGILLSFMAAFVQAISAILIVGVLAIALQATSIQLRATEAWLETISWGLIALFGAWMLYTQLRRPSHKGSAAVAPAPASAHAHAATHAAHNHGHHGHHAHEHHGHAHHAHAHDHHHHDHEHEHEHAADGSCCGHAHMPSPQQIGETWSWTRAWTLAFSVGIRPCTGAIAVMIFSLGIGLFWAGVLATFAMAIGTAITVSALAMLAVSSRDFAARAAGRGSAVSASIERTAAIAGAALILLFGVVFFAASLSGPTSL